MLKELYQKRPFNSSRYEPDSALKGNIVRLVEMGMVLSAHRGKFFSVTKLRFLLTTEFAKTAEKKKAEIVLCWWPGTDKIPLRYEREAVAI